MVKVNWSEQALDDLDDIGAYIAKDSIRYAQITVQELSIRQRYLKQITCPAVSYLNSRITISMK